MREAHSGAEIPIEDTTPEAFGSLLEYIYSGRICLSDLTEEVRVRGEKEREEYYRGIPYNYLQCSL